MTIPAVSIGAAALAIALTGAAATQKDQTWTDQFGVERGELVSSGRNPFFVLEPGYRLTLQDDDERLVITCRARSSLRRCPATECLIHRR